MKKKKKSKPRTQVFAKLNTTKVKAFKYYNKQMEETSKKFKEKNKNAFNINFYLFQNIREKAKLIDKLFELTYFYDRNFTGNKDFMHIPNIQQIMQNIYKYPVILATQNNGIEEEIVGATTVKLEKNNSILKNPYFPTKNETVLSITGVLAKQNTTDIFGNRIKGIGRELFKSAIRGAFNFNKEEKIRLISEIDCRNKNSLNAISCAVKELKDEGLNINLIMPGYYEIINMQGNLTEAPTFIVEIDLDGTKQFENTNTLFSYSNCSNYELFSNLSNVLENNATEQKQYTTKVNENVVCYHEIKPINALNIELEVGNTAVGNERVPVLNNIELEYAHI